MQTLRTSGFLFRVKSLSKVQCFPATPRLNGAVFSTNIKLSPPKMVSQHEKRQIHYCCVMLSLLSSAIISVRVLLYSRGRGTKSYTTQKIQASRRLSHLSVGNTTTLLPLVPGVRCGCATTTRFALSSPIQQGLVRPIPIIRAQL